MLLVSTSRRIEDLRPLNASYFFSAIFLVTSVSNMPIPPKMKVRGANMMRPKISNVHPKHKTKNFMLMKGDLVQVMRGKHEGCRGIIETVIKKHDKVKVEGVAMQVKHMKPNPFFPKGQYFKKETPIPCISKI